MTDSTMTDSQAPHTPTLDDYQWLTSAAAEPALALAAAHGDLLRAATKLRQQLSPARVTLLLEQVRLRGHAARKFTAADKMFFLATALEQATDQWIAAYKAQRFPSGAVVADFCCGIGGDLLALARRGTVHAVDRDPIVLLLAETNWQNVVAAEASGGRREQPAATFSAVEVEPALAADVAAWHIDPDRRPQGRRTTQAALHDPSPETIDRLRASQPNTAVKLAPAATLPEAWTHEAELEWISFDRQCRQLVAWFGALALEAGSRRATIVERDGAACTVAGPPDLEIPLAERVGAFVYEPDPAVLAAHLTGHLASQQQLAAVAAQCAYLTGDERLENRALATFAVADVLPLDLKRLSGLLARRDIGRLEVKQRGTDLQPDAVRRRLKLSGSGSATLLLYRAERSVMAIVASRLPGTGTSSLLDAGGS